MSYLVENGNDVFISYAHADNMKAWVTRFETELNKTLQKRIKIKEESNVAQISVWMDHSLPRHGELGKQLSELAGTAGILLVVMSPSYLLSEWCTKEGEWFHSDENRDRNIQIFILEIEKTDREKWPNFLRDGDNQPLIAREVYEEKRDKSLRPIDMVLRDGNVNPAMDNHLEELACELCSSLKAIKELSADGPTTKSGPGPDADKVFLASTPDLRGYERQDLKTFIEARGICVLPEQEPDSKQEWEQALEQHLPSCRRFVQLAGRLCGAAPEGYPGGFVGSLMDRVETTGKPISLWLPEDLDLEKVRPQEYRDYLQLRIEEFTTDDRHTYNHESSEGFVDHLVEVLSRPDPVPSGPVDLPPIPFVAINYERSDREWAHRIAEKLRATNKFIPIIPNEEVEKRSGQWIDAGCDGVILCWAGAPPQWFLAQFRRLVTHRDRDGKIEGVGMVQRPPGPLENADQYFHMFQLKGEQDADINTDELTDFCQKVVESHQKQNQVRH